LATANKNIVIKCTGRGAWHFRPNRSYCGFKVSSNGFRTNFKPM